ncbi:L,D-transpeptidase-like protein [Orenia marismortui]|uniref:L,D-transpeptidase-like protein n=2 Tax=Orenia marismortui TaxID=46469 RepID=A0A4R8GRD1_9FIRM|nr:L,D-transpeptidase-like protein [Orenia marismortui]
MWRCDEIYSNIDKRRYLLILLAILIIILSLLVIFLAQTYIPTRTLKQEESIMNTELYNSINDYLEEDRFHQNKPKNKFFNNTGLNKIRTAVLLYLEDHYTFPNSIEELKNSYLTDISILNTKWDYRIDQIKNKDLLSLIVKVLPENKRSTSNIIIDFKPYNLVVDRSKNRLFIREGNDILRSYPIAVGGIDNPTPVGEFRIKNKVKLEGEQKKVYGDYWIGIDLWTKGGSYGIHASNNKKVDLEEQKSKGCIRMEARDLEELYNTVPIRTKIVIR